MVRREGCGGHFLASLSRAAESTRFDDRGAPCHDAAHVPCLAALDLGPRHRTVALAYRQQRQAGQSDQPAYEAALGVYRVLHPRALDLDAAENVSRMIASVKREHGPWFWRGVKGLLALVFSGAVAIHAIAQDLTPAGNLTGITIVSEKISVALDLMGAEEFKLDAQKITAIVRDALMEAGVGTNGSGIGTPKVSVGISGQSSGRGTGQYTVEVVVRATIPSPFAKNRNVDAIFWRGAASGEQTLRFEPGVGIIEPSGTIDERVYTSIREVAARLAADFKNANASK